MNRLTNVLFLTGGTLVGSLGLILISSLIIGERGNVHAQTAGTQKPNILFIMGDDIGWMQPSIYHRGLMVGETPNIDRIGHEGAIFMDYLAMQSCTSGPTPSLLACIRYAPG
jgi:arylsulfatase